VGERKSVAKRTRMNKVAKEECRGNQFCLYTEKNEVNRTPSKQKVFQLG